VEEVTMLGPKRVPIAIIGTLIALTLAGGTAGAQDFGLGSGLARLLAAAAADHPAAIVDGSCTTVNAKSKAEGEYKLNDLKAGKTRTGDAAALSAGSSQTTIDAKFADLVKSPYALVIAGGTREPATIACGAITGTPTGDTLAIAIRPVGTSKNAGVAWLRKDGDKTRVMVLFAIGIVPQTQQPANAKSAPVSSTSPISYQAGVYQGSCAKPGTKVAYSLTAPGNAAPTTATTTAGSSSTATASQDTVIMSTTTIHAKLQDLLKDPHVVIIEPTQSAASQTKVLACGAIGGEMSGKSLPFALAAVDSSNDIAFAWLQENGNSTDVTLFLIPDVTASSKTS
jgi:hypothetical protein